MPNKFLYINLIKEKLHKLHFYYKQNAKPCSNVHSPYSLPLFLQTLSHLSCFLLCYVIQKKKKSNFLPPLLQIIPSKSRFSVHRSSVLLFFLGFFCFFFPCFFLLCFLVYLSLFMSLFLSFFVLFFFARFDVLCSTQLCV